MLSQAVIQHLYHLERTFADLTQSLHGIQSLFQAHIVSHATRLLNKGMVKESISRFNTKFPWDRNSLYSSAPGLIKKDIDKELISKMSNGNTAGLPSLVSEMVQAQGEAGADMISDLVNQIIVGVIPTEWKLSTFVNCYKEKGDVLKRGNYWEPKFTDLIIRTAEKVIENLIRQQADIHKMQFGFITGCGTTNAIF